MSEAYIVDAVRTPRGKRKGSLSLMHPVDLGAAPLQAIAAGKVERAVPEPEVTEDEDAAKPVKE